MPQEPAAEADPEDQGESQHKPADIDPHDDGADLHDDQHKNISQQEGSQARHTFESAGYRGERLGDVRPDAGLNPPAQKVQTREQAQAQNEDAKPNP